MSKLQQIQERLLELSQIKPRKRKEGSRFGDMYERILAATIDVKILFFIYGSFFAWLSQKIYSYADRDIIAQTREVDRFSVLIALWWDAGLVHLWAINSLIQLGMIAALVITFQSLYYATPGKMLLGLKVVRYPSLEKPSLFQLIVRFFAYIPSALIAMIGIIWISFQKEHRGWHDYIARTAVLQTRPDGWYVNKLKQGWQRLKGKEQQQSVLAEEPVAEPATNERHKNSE